MPLSGRPQRPAPDLAIPCVGLMVGQKGRVGQEKSDSFTKAAGGKPLGKLGDFLWISWGWVGKGERCGGFGKGWNFVAAPRAELGWGRLRAVGRTRLAGFWVVAARNKGERLTLGWC